MAPRKKAAPPPPPGNELPVLDALNEAVAAATHLTDMDKPAIEAARALARKIDLVDDYFDDLARDEERRSDRRAPAQDNVSIPTFLKYCESLGLTPAGRVRLIAEKKPEEKPRGQLASVSNIPRPS